jgi:hypothetical protein
MTTQLIYREDEVTASNLKVIAQQNGRTMSDELRAASTIYVALQNLAVLRLHRRSAVADVERRVKDEIGRVLLAAVPDDVHSRFENDVGIEYPIGRFGPIDTPFEKLIDWVVTGRGRDLAGDNG